MRQREQRLSRALEEVISDYEFILIDCPPALGLLTVNALCFADEVIVPIQCEYYALEGLGQLVGNVDLVKANLNPDLEISKIVLVMYDSRTKISKQVADEVREYFGGRVCKQIIPRSVRLVSLKPRHMANQSRFLTQLREAQSLIKSWQGRF